MKTKKPGRPRKGKKKRVRTSFTLPPEVLKDIERQAKDLGLSRSDVIVQLFKGVRDDDFKAKVIARSRFPLSSKQLIQFCQKHHIIKFALFGSVLRKDFTDKSDVGVLVDFDPKNYPDLFDIVRMEFELSKLVGGRKIDMRTVQELSRYFRDEVVAGAEVLYEKKIKKTSQQIIQKDLPPLLKQLKKILKETKAC